MKSKKSKSFSIFNIFNIFDRNNIYYNSNKSIIKTGKATAKKGREDHKIPSSLKL
jgi:hypothetical protein